MSQKLQNCFLGEEKMLNGNNYMFWITVLIVPPLYWTFYRLSACTNWCKSRIHRERKGNECNTTNVVIIIDIVIADYVFLEHSREGLLWFLGDGPGERVLGVRHTVPEGHIHHKRRHKQTSYSWWFHLFCSLFYQLVLHDVDHLVLPHPPGQHHHQLLSGEERKLILHSPWSCSQVLRGGNLIG